MPVIRPDDVTDIEVLYKWTRTVDPDDRVRLRDLALEAEKRPGAAAYEVCTVDEIDGDNVTVGGVTFNSRPLSRLFDADMTVYPYVATCGREMAEFGETLSDPLERYWWDMIMQGAVGHARNAMHKVVAAIAGYEPASVNPGSIELWPISNQPALFSLVGDVESLIGVTVAPSFLMMPLKSVSGIFFPGSGDFTHNCCLCTRESCPNRRVPFDAKLKAALESGHSGG